ncbi:NTP transferase domain-containing protein [Nitrosococcus wardiae]|uniref:NTP transferase domain-containing protein n=1 Tax=Nitrosococcus wardiae TaxID=1814290 RepID=UPI001F0F1F97|nr:NTP transferase domain-containing protein [Nitrosococcus wardiae]
MPGPLAGMLSALAVIETEYLLTVPCDCPLLPQNLVSRLSIALGKTSAEISVASNGIRRQPVFLLFHRRLKQDLADYLNEGGRKIDTWLGQHPLAEADFSEQPDAFLNVNTPRDIDELESRLEGHAPLNPPPDWE